MSPGARRDKKRSWEQPRRVNARHRAQPYTRSSFGWRSNARMMNTKLVDMTAHVNQCPGRLKICLAGTVRVRTREGLWHALSREIAPSPRARFPRQRATTATKRHQSKTPPVGTTRQLNELSTSQGVNRSIKQSEDKRT